MATLTYNAVAEERRNVAVTASTSGALSGTVAVLIDNTVTDKKEIIKLLEGILRRWHRDGNKNSQTDTIPTTGTTLE